jgi:Ca-activated chloride channel family protein
MRTLWMLAALALLAAPLQGQGWIEPVPGRPMGGVVKVRTNVSVRVTDRIAHVAVEEWFRNNGGGLGEGDYLYPLPGEAVFSNFSLFQGDQELRGETMDAERARQIYEEIVRRKKDPALIELVGHGLLRSRVFPINPGETRRITLRYTQVLKRAGDALQFRYTAAGRFAGIALAGREGPQGAQRTAEPAPLTFTLEVANGAQFRDAFSPTHEVRVTRAEDRMTVRPTGSLEGDFSLFLPLAGNPVGLTLAAHRPSGEDGYFMLTLSPGEVRAARVPRDVTVVVDVSGSMSGEKIDQSRRALLQLLGTLSEQDRFRLIRFNSGVQTYRPEWTVASAQEVREARRWVEGLQVDGGTNIAGALDEAFRATTPENRLGIVIFMTDGLPSVGETNPERIAAQTERVRGNARVFAFGVGYDVNTYLLERLGAAGRGGSHFVQPGEDVEEAMGTLAARIRHPVLSDLALGDAPVRLKEIYPSSLPDLFAGEELVIFGRYEGARDGALTLTGRRNGRNERFQTQAQFPAHTNDNDFVPRLWASRKLGELTRQIRLNGVNQELVQEIRQTAMRYGLLSEYTSYLVQEPLLAGNMDAMLRGRAAAAMAPSVQTGQAAVMEAQQAVRDRSVRNLSDLEKAQSLRAEESQGGRSAGVQQSQLVSGRTFVQQRSGAWEDASQRPGQRIVEVQAFSAAYFQVLQKLPELQPYWKQMQDVLVAGGKVSVRVGRSGAQQLSSAELQRLVTEFRAQ